MTARHVEQLLWLTTFAVIAAGGAGAIVMQQPLGAVAATLPPRAPPRVVASSRTAEGRLRAVLAGDLFRRERGAVQAAVSALPRSTPGPPALPKPPLVLRGLVGGPPWNAILDGVPGHDGGFVVRAGDSVAGLKIQSVRRDGATIRGMDTTWILRLGRAP